MGKGIYDIGPKALIVNIARGSFLDQDALIEAMSCWALKGVALDIACPEARAPPAGLPAVGGVQLHHLLSFEPV